MTAETDAPVDLYVAAYADPDSAREDWDAIKQLADDDVIKVEGLILVSRRADGKIHVDDDFHTAAKGAAWGAVGGVIVGLIFPPSLLAGAPVGAGAGLGIGGLRRPRDEGRDQGRRRGRIAAEQLRHRRDVRRAVGHRRRQGPVEGRARSPRPGRPQQRPGGQGRGSERRHAQLVDRSVGRLPTPRSCSQN